MTVPMKAIDVREPPRRFDVTEREAYWRRRWEELGIHRRDANARRERSFVIDSPPPTVSGALHVGHIFSYTHQDLLARYKRMAGWNVVYPMGWDDNGLPTERRVQNYFGVRAEPDVPYVPDLDVQAERKRHGLKKDQQLVISRGNFIEMCHRVTAMDEVAFKELFQRMGYSIDWRDEYATIDDRNRRIAQRSFLDVYQRGHVYQLEAPTMWDVDFQTAVAQAEVEDREKPGAYHDIEFGMSEADAPVDSFIISTTRPELLGACVGVTAHPEDERYKGLFGKHAVTPLYFARVPIFPSEEADPEKATGILMVCTFGDQTDVQWWREQQLGLRQIIGHGAPLKSEPRPITHPVRYYEKGESPLEYLTTRQWFVRILDKKDRLLDMGGRIRWHPEFMRKRYANWTENLQIDWCISRQRFFGVPIPVWYPLDAAGRPHQAASPGEAESTRTAWRAAARQTGTLGSRGGKRSVPG